MIGLVGLGACHLLGGAGDLEFRDAETEGTGGAASGATPAATGGAGGIGGAGASSTSTTSGSGGAAALVPLPSCEGLSPTCGASGTEDCCERIPVPGATFPHLGASISVSSFRLDRFEVTVGRFRRFVAAGVDGWQPAAGSGRHDHVSATGLTDDPETGWNSAWNASLPTDAPAWDAMLSCEEFGSGATAYVQWTPTPGEREHRPIACVSWQTAYAFCIFDGGFLPTEAEWSLAATGGQPASYPHPWGTAAPSADHAAFDCPATACDRESVSDVGMHPLGAGPFGHDDLAGNLWEWTLDQFSNPFAKAGCIDCVVRGGGTFSVRGGAFGSPAAEMTTDTRRTFALPRGSGIGFRCAAPPSPLP